MYSPLLAKTSNNLDIHPIWHMRCCHHVREVHRMNEETPPGQKAQPAVTGRLFEIELLDVTP
jgi:hypothetical protein